MNEEEKNKIIEEILKKYSQDDGKTNVKKQVVKTKKRISEEEELVNRLNKIRSEKKQKVEEEEREQFIRNEILKQEHLKVLELEESIKQQKNKNNVIGNTFQNVPQEISNVPVIKKVSVENKSPLKVLNSNEELIEKKGFSKKKVGLFILISILLTSSYFFLYISSVDKGEQIGYISAMNDVDANIFWSAGDFEGNYTYPEQICLNFNNNFEDVCFIANLDNNNQ